MNALWITCIFVEILPGFDIEMAVGQAISLAQEANCEVVIVNDGEKITITSTTLVDEVMEEHFSQYT